MLLAAYGIALALIAFWPTPVDRGMSGVLAAVSAAVPWLTYTVIEFSANIMLFAPFGLLAALGWPRRHMFVVPAAVLISTLIELGQGVLLPARTATVVDVIANTLGAAVGWLLALLVSRSATRR